MAKLVAMIDGSSYTASVCDHAAWAATRLGASVEVLHVLGRRDVSSVPANLSGNLGADSRDTLLTELASFDQQKAKLAHLRGRMILEDARARLGAAGVGDVTTRLRNGDLVDTVAEFEVDAELVVIGKRGEAADFATLHLGSNLERVVRSSHKPVLVASRAFRPVQRFLIAFDGGTSAMKAVDHVARSPVFAGLEGQLLMVGTETSEARRQLEGAEAMLRGGGISVRADIVAGQSDAAIAARVESDAVDLLVMGAYGHSRIRTLIIGSTTTSMIRSCKVPVMLFR